MLARLLGIALAAAAESSGGAPEGWVRLPEATPAFRECANRSMKEWDVRWRKAGLEITPADLRRDDPLPFALPREVFKHPKARQRVAKVEGGYLAGYDAGEWGGGLYWFSPDGAAHRQLLDRNVRAVAARSPDLALAVGGLNHEGLRQGFVVRLERGPDGAWKAGAEHPLDAGPDAVLATPEALWVTTPSSLYRVTDDHAERVQPLDVGGLYPNSLARAPDGTLYLGMRLAVLRLVPEGPRFRVEWLVPRGCQAPRLVGSQCVCAGEKPEPE